MVDLIKSAKKLAIDNCHRITVIRGPTLLNPELHLKSVAQLVANVTQDENMIAAAWLHSIVADSGITIGDIGRRFGAGVAKLLDDLTPVSYVTQGNRTVRLALAKRHFANVSAAAKTVLLADLIDTCRCLSKEKPTVLGAYVAEAHELAQVLDGGDERLLARLKRDLEKYAPVSALQVFERSFAADDLAEPLTYFDSDIGTNAVFDAMSVAGVRIAGLQREGIPWGYAEVANKPDGSCEVRFREFAASQIVAAKSSIIEVIEVLVKYDWCFVTALERVIGAISRPDLHKPAMRMWLFGIATITEIELTERRFHGDRSGLRHRANPRIEPVTQEAGSAAQSAITAQNAAGVAQKKTDAADISAKNAIGDAQSAHGEAKAASTAAGTAEASATATGKQLEAVEIQLPPRRSDLALAVHTTSRVLHAIADRLLVYIQSVGEPVAAGIVARMRWENVKDFLSRNRSSAVDEVEEVEPRSLSEREASWINDIRRVVSDWRDADLSGTRVVAEGANAEGYSLFLRGSKPENPHSTSSHGILGQLWIETEDRLKINVQLFQWEGHLRELYVLVLDSQGRNVRLPSAWIEVSRKAVNG